VAKLVGFLAFQKEKEGGNIMIFRFNFVSFFNLEKIHLKEFNQK